MMVTFPEVVFGLVVAFLAGALYHAIRGGGGWRLLFYFGLSVLGLAAGHWVGAWQNWNYFVLGSLNLGVGIPGSLLFLIGGEWLSRIEVKKESGV